MLINSGFFYCLRVKVYMDYKNNYCNKNFEENNRLFSYTWTVNLYCNRNWFF